MFTNDTMENLAKQLLLGNGVPLTKQRKSNISKTKQVYSGMWLYFILLCKSIVNGTTGPCPTQIQLVQKICL